MTMTTDATADVRSLVLERPVVVLGRRGCCMCDVISRLLQGLGVNPAIHDLDERRGELAAAAEDLKELIAEDAEGAPVDLQLPAVFIGGKYVGGLERLMAAHISGALVPILKEAGALWL